LRLYFVELEALVQFQLFGRIFGAELFSKLHFF